MKTLTKKNFNNLAAQYTSALKIKCTVSHWIPCISSLNIHLKFASHDKKLFYCPFGHERVLGILSVYKVTLLAGVGNRTIPIHIGSAKVLSTIYMAIILRK